MFETMVKEYKDVKQFQKEAAAYAAWGWQVVNVTDQNKGRSGAAKGAAVGGALLTGGILAPAAILTMSKSKHTLFVTYQRDNFTMPELPTIVPEGLGLFQSLNWYEQVWPSGMNDKQARGEWEKMVTANVKARAKAKREAAKAEKAARKQQ
jgi:hypothetical protein